MAEVAEGADPDVGRVVPLVGQPFGNGHMSTQHAETVGPVGKVGEGNDANTANACGFAQHGFSVAQVLQGVDLQHHVEAVVFKNGQAIVEVELQHVDALLQARLDFGVVDFDTVATALAVGLQVGQQVAIATAQVQNARPFGHQLRNEGLQCGITPAEVPVTLGAICWLK